MGRGFSGGEPSPRRSRSISKQSLREVEMGRGILLLLLGVPLPIVILLALFWH
jgi:hypothetical protein